jgi:hypothetical protein
VQYANFVTGALAQSTDWSDDASRPSGNVHTYVTEYDDTSLPGAVDGKRVTVAVTAGKPASRGHDHDHSRRQLEARARRRRGRAGDRDPALHGDRPCRKPSAS